VVGLVGSVAVSRSWGHGTGSGNDRCDRFGVGRGGVVGGDGGAEVAGHVGLDISYLDRLYLTGFVAKLQTPGGVVYFLHDHRGNPIPSPALFERIGNKFRADMKAWAQANAVPVVTFKVGDRKADVMAPYLQAAADARVPKWSRSARPRSSHRCGPPGDVRLIRVGVRGSPSRRSSGGCRCPTSTSGISGWTRGSSRSAPIPVSDQGVGQRA
jgi:hypothetical protein